MPFWVIEFGIKLRDEGVLAVDEFARSCELAKDLSEVEFPPSLMALITSRIVLAALVLRQQLSIAP